MNTHNISLIEDSDSLMMFIKSAMAENHVRIEQICANSNLHRSSVYRILNGQVSPSIDSVFDLLHAAGCRLFISKL